MSIGTVAIVGRPNVGKSTVFNRLIGERLSIVDETPGVTRDRLYGSAEWLTKTFNVIDTGGIQIADQPYQVEIKAQVDIAIEQADVILMLTNGQQGCTDDDMYIARMLQRCQKKVILAVNKIDDVSFRDNIFDFYKLGLGDPVAISGVHGIGIGDLCDAIIAALPPESGTPAESAVRFAVIGRPNVGKSSLVNAILNQQRAIVSDVQGTTRDAVDTPFERNGRKYVVVDTAGIRKRGRIYENIEKYAVLRAMTAIEKCDIVLFVIDASVELSEQDKHVAGYAVDAGKGVIIVANKWDLVDKDDKTMDEKTKLIHQQMAYLDYAPIAFVSALTKSRVNTLFDLIDNVYEMRNKKISTNVLNEVIADAQVATPPPTHKGKRLRIGYCLQVSTAPPTFVFFVNDPDLMHFSYKRFLENQLRVSFGFDGNPVRIIARAK